MMIVVVVYVSFGKIFNFKNSDKTKRNNFCCSDESWRKTVTNSTDSHHDFSLPRSVTNIGVACFSLNERLDYEIFGKLVFVPVVFNSLYFVSFRHCNENIQCESHQKIGLKQ